MQYAAYQLKWLNSRFGWTREKGVLLKLELEEHHKYDDLVEKAFEFVESKIEEFEFMNEERKQEFLANVQVEDKKQEWVQ